jgi:DNA-binding MarR family transcriptional regulator
MLACPTFALPLWRRRIELELAPLGLTLTQWRVLDALAVIFRDTNDAVAQVQVDSGERRRQRADAPGYWSQTLSRR